MTTATHHIARLATLSGEGKTTEYVKALAAQQPILGPLGTFYSRLQLGEVLVAITLTDSFIHEAKVHGAPIVHATEVTPVISPAFSKGRRIPTQGISSPLFCRRLRPRNFGKVRRP